ncbi:hypothetical protein MMC29_005169 [Sticta canariensis]|nr:hypothetical protein [Sticta canariensis]
MLKRKFKEFHEDEVGTNSLSNNGLRAQQEKLKNILEQSKKALTRALRIAKRIERQKLGRRQKTAKESNAVPERSRLNTEVASLKALDLSAKAEIYLYKSILKSKPIVSTAAFPSYVLAKVKTAAQPQDIAHANVQARLFNSSVVKVAMTNIMDSIRVALGIGNEEKAGKKRRMRAADYAPENKPIKQAPLKQLGPGKILATEEEDKYDRRTQSPMESLHAEPDVACSENESIKLAVYGARLAESEDESAQELYSQESSTEHKPEHCTFRDPSPSPSRSTSSSSSVLDSPKPRKIPTTTPRSTIFLPSLAMGGYISDPDSDFAVSDPFSLAGNATPKRRKNRRGQQERRQIWEKKYGGNANHLKGQAQQQQRKHDQGWDSQKGATGVGGNDRGKRGKGRGRGRVVDAVSGSSDLTARARAAGKGRVGPIRSGANSDPVQARRGGNKGHDASAKGNQTRAAAAAYTPLHPSWEAAKRKKEANKNVAFQGKKVVFS